MDEAKIRVEFLLPLAGMTPENARAKLIKMLKNEFGAMNVPELVSLWCIVDKTSRKFIEEFLSEERSVTLGIIDSEGDDNE